jgi:NAD(P)-dependent dehydrogenase (short-subunit alcohol dehydrogenase family)
MNFFVTGGSRGIGEAIVLQAVQEGNDVAFTYLDQADRAACVVERAKTARSGALVKAYQMDIRNSASVEETGDQVLADFDKIDVVVCNAGINRLNLLVQMSDEEWDDVVRTNLTGSFYVARYFLSSMMAQRFGRFILVSSIGYAGITGQANYCASKAGLHGLASAIAKEYGRRGITANVIVPGFFDTDMSRDGTSVVNKEFWKQYCPLGRTGELGEISKVVTFLTSAGAGFINGQAIPVNGGLDWAP